MASIKLRPGSGLGGVPRRDGAAGGGGASHRDDTDDQICRALKAGQGGAAEAVYDRVADVVETVLYRLLGADAERDDLSQQAIERVISTVVSGRYQRGCSLRSWATLLAQHVAIDALRARARERRLFDRSATHQALELVAAHTDTPERLADTRRRVDLLQSALASVGRDRSEAVVLHDVLGHDLAEIAKLKGVSLAAAQSRLVRGRRDVLKWIRAHEAPDGGSE
jgi:RNA polymerase sigma-70 factor (ECF subfamily)